jgi:oligoribonuclease
MKPFKYASIDLETTGLDPSYCRIIQFGAVLDDLESPLDELPRYEVLVLNEGNHYPGQSYAFKMNADLMGRIAKCHATLDKGEEETEYWVTHQTLSRDFQRFLQAWDWDGEGLLCAGKNYASFDARFLDLVPGWQERIKPRHRTLDPGSMYFEAGDGSRPPGLSKCLQRAGIENTEVAHTAVADALQVVQLIRFKMGVPF